MIKPILIFVVLFTLAACSSFKKVPANPAVYTPATNNTAVSTFPTPKPTDGVHAPENEELAAIQSKYKDVTLDKLKEGHMLYTQSACIQCHAPLNIYAHSEEKWKDIIGDMAQRAQITDSQRDAVYKYVLAIKATQPR